MSADMMTRNLDRRVEAGIPIRDRDIHATLADYFDIQWGDNTKARIIAPPFENIHVARAAGEEAHRSQTELYEYFKSKNR
jgi:polyphosphate kinase